MSVRCHSYSPEKDEKYVENQIVEHREELATEMFNHVPLDRASRMMNISPLELSDIVPSDAGSAQDQLVGEEGDGGGEAAARQNQPRRRRRPTKNWTREEETMGIKPETDNSDGITPMHTVILFIVYARKRKILKKGCKVYIYLYYFPAPVHLCETRCFFFFFSTSSHRSFWIFWRSPPEYRRSRSIRVGVFDGWGSETKKPSMNYDPRLFIFKL